MMSEAALKGAANIEAVTLSDFKGLYLGRVRRVRLIRKHIVFIRPKHYESLEGLFVMLSCNG